MPAVLDPRVTSRLSRFLPAFKQFVNLIRQGKTDAECGAELAKRKMLFNPPMEVKEAVVYVANLLSVPEGNYDERREAIRDIGLQFFGGDGVIRASPKRHHAESVSARASLPKAKAVVPTAQQIAEAILLLSPQERVRLAVGTDKTLAHAERARRLELKHTSLPHTLKKIYSKIGFDSKKGMIDLKERNALIQKALALLAEAA